MISIRSLLLCAVTLTSVVACNAGARAQQDASPWAVDIRSASRLIAANAPLGATQLHTGVELRAVGRAGWFSAVTSDRLLRSILIILAVAIAVAVLVRRALFPTA